MKAEKYIISIEVGGELLHKVRYGFGAAGEEVQRQLEIIGTERIRVKIEDTKTEITFVPGRAIRLLEIKQRIKGLSFEP